MAVSLVPKFTRAEITAYLQEQQARIARVILLRLQRIGEEFVKNARENGTYQDRTGNLRSSIGYVVLQDGVQIRQNFQRFPGKEGKGKGKSKGVQQAKEVIDEVKKNFPKGFVLIGVAGMDYAAAVESRGYDVLTASSITAERDLQSAVRTIQSSLQR